MSKENDVKGKFHYVDSNRDFTCLKCKNFRRQGWKDRSSFSKANRECGKLGKYEFEIKDGDCPYSFNEFKIINWEVYEYD